jgi:hypothetical protein
MHFGAPSYTQTLWEHRCDLLAVSATIALRLFAVRDLIKMVRTQQEVGLCAAFRQQSSSQ